MPNFKLSVALLNSCNFLQSHLKELGTYILFTLGGNSLPKSCSYFETLSQRDSSYAK